MTAPTFSVYPLRFTPDPGAWRPFLEALGLVELEHGPRNNRVRAR